jgi:hypothetical protein
MLLKYAVDAAVVWLFADQVWSPLDYLLPSYSLRASKVQHFPAWLLVGPCGPFRSSGSAAA